MAWKAAGFMNSCQSSGWATTKTLSAGVGGVSRRRAVHPEISIRAERETYLMPLAPQSCPTQGGQPGPGLPPRYVVKLQTDLPIELEQDIRGVPHGMQDHARNEAARAH